MRNKLFACAALLLATASNAAELPRKAALGVRMSAVPSGEGVRIDEVMPGSTAAAIGLRVGDVVGAAGQQRLRAPADLAAYAGSLTAGDQVSLRVRRSGGEVVLTGAALGRPMEKYDAASVDYGAVPFRDGLLRDILVLPSNSADSPVVFLVQGYACGSIEPSDPEHPYRKLGTELLKRGIGYYRVEKVGLGDSRGSLRCQEIDHDTELAAFQAAYDHLVQARKIAPNRIFMFGHSLGGMQAPVLAAKRPPRGIAAYGTVLRNWADYHHDLDTFQGFMFRGEDPADAFARAERNRDLFKQFYFDRKSPAEIVAAHPGFGDGLRELFGWDGGTQVFGRNYRFNQQLAQLNVIPAWKGARTNVLSMYGESDIVALYDIDHKLLADMANLWRPGSGRYVEIPRTDHGMGIVGNRQEVREKTRAAGSPPDGPFNVAVAETLAAWIKESMTKPPVAS